MHPWDVGDDFVIYKCAAAAHAVRVGSTPPTLRQPRPESPQPTRPDKTRPPRDARRCPTCGRIFRPKRSNTKYCRLRCSQRAARAARAAITRSKLPRSSSIRDTVRLEPEARRIVQRVSLAPAPQSNEWAWLRTANTGARAMVGEQT
jgi:hypothetical protein